MAKAFRDKIFNKLPKARKEAAAHVEKELNKAVNRSHSCCFQKAAGKVYAYWQAAWTEGKTRKTAKFSVARNAIKV